MLDQTHQKKETKLLKIVLELLELQYDYHEVSLNDFPPTFLFSIFI